MTRTKTADYVFIAVCLLLGGMVVRSLVRGDARGPANAITTSRKYVEVVEPSAAHTVVLYVSPKCQFCTESMPFYKRLYDTAQRGRSESALRFANVDDDVSALTSYLQQHKIYPYRTATGPVPAEVQGTPTVLVFDKSGNVVAGWMGILSSDQENAVLAYWK